MISRSTTIPCGWRAQFLAAADHQDAGQATAGDGLQLLAGVGRAADWLTVDLGDDVEPPQSALTRRAARVDLGHDGTGGAARQLEPPRDVGRDVLEPDPEARRFLTALSSSAGPAFGLESSSPMVTLSAVFLPSRSP